MSAAHSPNEAQIKGGGRVLLSAYACAPNQGSDPEIGWNWMQQLARRHDVWVLTRAKNRPSIEKGLEKEPAPQARFVYLDLPKPLMFWKSWPGGIYLYYYAWQVLAWLKARRLNREIGFDRAHHVSFCTYWLPSFMPLLPIPFVWGPVGGGESMPAGFRQACGFRGRLYERLRDLARLLGSLDPMVRLMARRSVLTLATTAESAARLEALHCRRVEVMTCVGIPQRALAASCGLRSETQGPLRLFSAGRLLHWKGFHLTLEAIARARQVDPSLDVRYDIYGSGPELSRLRSLKDRLALSGVVHLLDPIPRNELLRRMSGYDGLLHPSLHDSGAFVCVEAMASGCFVICLDLGGPALQVTEASGIKIAARTSEQAIADLAETIRRLARDAEARRRLSQGASERAHALSWEDKAELLEEYWAVAEPEGSYSC